MAILKSENSNLSQIKSFLDSKVEQYNNEDFIISDPISIPKRFSNKEDIEIAGFFAASLAWGNRTAIIKKATELLRLMEDSPYQFLLSASHNELKAIRNFVYRTFNGDDALFFVERLKEIYQSGGLEKIFTQYYSPNSSIYDSISGFRKVFMGEYEEVRTSKHVANVLKNSAAKRMNMYLRWMVRKDNCGVDFGLWKGISSADLMLPLDVHTGRVARKLGLLQCKQDDWKAVEEITEVLRKFDSEDPVKYDFALFGLGVFEKYWDGK